jgi:anti-anti-sigma factor
MPLLGQDAGSGVFRDLEEHPEDQTVAGIAVLRLDGGLFFATAEALEERIRGLVDAQPLHGLVLDLGGAPFVDSQGSAKLAEIHELVDGLGITLRLARVKPQVADVLRRDGLIDRIGADHIHGDLHRAVQAQLDVDARPGPG